MKNLFALIFAFLMVSLAFGQQGRDFLRDVQAAEIEITSAKADPVALTQVLNRYYQLMVQIDPRHYDLAQIRRDSTRIAKHLQEFRIRLKNEMKKWPTELLQSPEFQQSILAIERATHYAEDIVAEVSMNNQKMKKGERAMPAFSGGLPWTYTPDGKPLRYESFQSGDVLLMRGGSSVSAAIARVGDLDAIFSHAAIVYVDEKTGQKFVVEALIEKGLTINPLQKTLEGSAGRMVAMRPRDGLLGQKGAEALYRIAKASIETQKTIVYDFSMSEKLPNLKFNEIMSYFEGNREPRIVEEMKNFKVFCSLLVNFADKLGRESLGYDPNVVPFHVRSSLNPKNRAFLERLGIQPHQKDVYAPGDVQMDSRFELIGDFREPRRTAALRTDDFILDKIFDWMNRDGLQFNESAALKAISTSIHATSKVAPVRDLYQAAGFGVAPHVPPAVLSTVIMIDHMRNQILQRIAPSLQAFEQRYGVPMSPALIYQEIEKVYQSENGVLKYLVKPEGSGRSCRSMIGK